MRENKSKYAVLGLLGMGPMSGYDIKKKFEKITGNFWKESYGQIYPILKRLADKGLATKSIEKQDGKPDRHIYALTEEGRGVLQKWLVEPVARHIGRHEILLKLFFGRQISVAENIRQVEHFRNLSMTELADIEAIESSLETEKRDDPNRIFQLMTANYGKHINRANLGWCDDTLSQLRKMDEKTENTHP
jgi:DNA-binding PadR family transcriptional regulator